MNSYFIFISFIYNKQLELFKGYGYFSFIGVTCFEYY